MPRSTSSSKKDQKRELLQQKLDELKNIQLDLEVLERERMFQHKHYP